MTPEQQDNEQQELLDKLEIRYYPIIRRTKNKFTEESAERFLILGIPFTQLDKDLFLSNFSTATKQEAYSTIIKFGTWNDLLFHQETKPRLYDFLFNQYWEKHGLEKSKLAGDTLFEDIKKVIQVGNNQNKTYAEIAKDILKIKKINKWRAKTIVRTEIGRASAYVEKEITERIMRETGENVLKTWMSAEDKRVRRTHAEVNRQTILWQEYFIVGGEMMFMPKFEGSAENVINGRCVLGKKFERDRGYR